MFILKNKRKQLRLENLKNFWTTFGTPILTGINNDRANENCVLYQNTALYAIIDDLHR